MQFLGKKEIGQGTKCVLIACHKKEIIHAFRGFEKVCFTRINSIYAEGSRFFRIARAFNTLRLAHKIDGPRQSRLTELCTTSLISENFVSGFHRYIHIPLTRYADDVQCLLKKVESREFQDDVGIVEAYHATSSDPVIRSKKP